jgi:hypothetical protein
VCESGCEMMLRCVGDGGRPAVGRGGAGVCSGVRGTGVLLYVHTFRVGSCRCGGWCVYLRGSGACACGCVCGCWYWLVSVVWGARCLML